MSISLQKEQKKYFDEMLEALERNELFAWDLETTGFSPFRSRVTGISFAVPDETVPARCTYGCCDGEMFPRSWYIPFVPERAHHMSNEDAVERFPGEYYPMRGTFDRIRAPMENPDKKKVGQNLKFDLKFTTQSGIKVRGQIIDTCLAASLCDENRLKQDLKTLSEDFLGHEMVRYKELGGLFSPGIETYGADDSCQSLRLWTDVFEPQLRKEGLTKCFLELECRIVPVLSSMELKGTKIDVDYLDELDKHLISERKQTREEAFQLAGQRFEITSTEAVGVLLFEILKWRKRGETRTATGKYSTSEDVLTRYMTDRDPKKVALAKAIIKDRKIGKLKSTYVETLRDDARRLHDGRVRSLFNQVHKPWEDSGGCVTGRFSSSASEDGGTNFQNIPSRTNPYLGDTGKKIRRAFVAEEGNDLIVLDFSQIELRFLAHYSKDPTLLRAYRAWDCAECGGSGELLIGVHECPQCGAPDGHRRREKNCDLCDASDKPEDQPRHGFCLSLDLHQITADRCNIPRHLGKMANFLLIYGGQAKLLAQQAGISLKLAEKVREAFVKSYPGLERYWARCIRDVMRLGFVTTVLKRRRRFPHKRGRSVKPWEREWRQAVNHPIQGSAADLMKVAMRNVHERFLVEELDADTGIILQVHDEMAVETPTHRSDYVFGLMQHEMEHAFRIEVPIIADGSIGKSWGECK